MSELYKSIDGQSLVDVCLNTYGSLDNFIKLLQDSAIESSNVIPPSGQSFFYDKSLVIDQQVNRTTTLGNIRYATAAGANGSTFYVVTGKPAAAPSGGSTPYVPPSSGGGSGTYEKVSGTDYTIMADDELIINLPALTGKTIVQIELEQKPLKTTEWAWNAGTAILTISGVPTFAGQTLFILYSEIITP